MAHKKDTKIILNENRDIEYIATITRNGVVYSTVRTVYPYSKEGLNDALKRRNTFLSYN